MGKIKSSFQPSPAEEVINQQPKIEVEAKRKLKKPSSENAEPQRFIKGQNGIGVIGLINQKLKDIAFGTRSMVEDIKHETSSYEIDLKYMAVTAILAALGISAVFFVRHCIDKSNQDTTPIKEVMIDASKKSIPIETILEDFPNQTELSAPALEQLPPIQEQTENLILKHFPNGFSLKKGDIVYKTSYQAENDMARIAYDYEGLQCDLIRVIKDNEVIKAGQLSDIDTLYQLGAENDAHVMLRMGVPIEDGTEDGTMAYVAWCDINDMIKNSERSIEEQSTENPLPQEEYEEDER